MTHRSNNKTDKKAHKRRKQLQQLEHCPPRLAHETMRGIPAFDRTATALIARLKGADGTTARLFCEDDLKWPEVDLAMQERYAIAKQVYGWTHEDALLEVQQLCTHLACAANHEVGGRKTFWVGAELADALQQTNLDIAGDVLRIPFPCCAFVFNDTATLQTIQTLIDTHTTSKREPFRTLTVYVFASGEGSEQGYDFVFMADAYDGEWPYMLSRSVSTDSKRNLDEILASHPEESTDPVFYSVEMNSLLHLVINAILYTTCEDYRVETRSPATPALRGAVPGRRLHFSHEDVFYLPGRIVVGNQGGESHPHGEPSYIIQKRFWVRGHWRRPNPSWEDQRLRWIAPYLKGPELTAVIEREYELRGPVRASPEDKSERVAES
jgi:hypothetical protein